MKKYDYLVYDQKNIQEPFLNDIFTSVSALIKSKFNEDHKKDSAIQKAFKNNQDISLCDSYSVSKIEADY